MDPSPGWYPDVTQPGKKRWFDGQRWTDDRRDASDPDQDPPPPRGQSAPSTDRTSTGWQAQQMPSAGPLPRIQTSGLAIASVALGLLWIFGLGSLMGIVLALLAFRQIKRSQGLVGGKVVATVGLLISVTTLSLTVVAALRLDDVVDGVKDNLVEQAVKAELLRAGDAMTRYQVRNGRVAPDVEALVEVDYRPAADMSVAVGRATFVTWCLEALHQDATTVWRMEQGEAPQPGRC